MFNRCVTWSDHGELVEAAPGLYGQRPVKLVALVGPSADSHGLVLHPNVSKHERTYITERYTTLRYVTWAADGQGVESPSHRHLGSRVVLVTLVVLVVQIVFLSNVREHQSTYKHMRRTCEIERAQ